MEYVTISIPETLQIAFPGVKGFLPINVRKLVGENGIMTDAGLECIRHGVKQKAGDQWATKPMDREVAAREMIDRIEKGSWNIRGTGEAKQSIMSKEDFFTASAKVSAVEFIWADKSKSYPKASYADKKAVTADGQAISAVAGFHLSSTHAYPLAWRKAMEVAWTAREAKKNAQAIDIVEDMGI